MGTPKKQRKKYKKPRYPWKIVDLEAEGRVVKKYGLKNKKEVRKGKAQIRQFRKEARTLIGKSGGGVVEEEKAALFRKLRDLGIVDAKTLDEVLALELDDLLERRLQTLVYRKGLAKTIEQARQFVVHRHVLIGNRAINIPGYIVSKSEEDNIRVVGIPEIIKQEKPETKAVIENEGKGVEKNEKGG